MYGKQKEKYGSCHAFSPVVYLRNQTASDIESRISSDSAPDAQHASIFTFSVHLQKKKKKKKKKKRQQQQQQQKKNKKKNIIVNYWGVVHTSVNTMIYVTSHGH